MAKHLPHAATVRRFVETIDRKLLALFEDGDEPDDERILSIANLEMARNAALRMLDEAEDAER